MLRLRVIGLALGSLELVRYAVRFAGDWLDLAQTKSSQVSSLTAWFSVLVVFVLAEVFRRRRAPAPRSGADDLIMPIRVLLDRVLLERRMSLTELADRVGVTIANLSILKTGKARALRLSTLDALCRELQCQPGDIVVH